MAANDAMELLGDELKNEDLEVRVAALDHVLAVAKLLGPTVTRETLVPMLTEHLDDEDEAVFKLADVLGQLVPFVGANDHAAVLVAPLITIAAVEEAVVRDKAMASLDIVIKHLTETALLNLVLPAFRTLVSADWFTSRVSASACIALLYRRISNKDARAEIRTMYTALCKDDTPMVRRAAAKVIGDVAQVYEKEVLLSELLPLFHDISADEQDTVRYLALDATATFSKLLNNNDNITHIAPLVKACLEDRSWRIRIRVATNLHVIAQALGAEYANAELLNLLIKVLQDPEAEVRAASVPSIVPFFSLIGSESFITNLMPVVRELALDVVQSVRVVLSTHILELAPKLGTADCTAHLLPLVLSFLRDETSEVRLNILSNLSQLTEVIGVDLVVSSVLPSIVALYSDTQWRVRQSVLQLMPLMATTVGQTVFTSKLLPILTSSAFTDPVALVRLAGAECLPSISIAFGVSWVRSRLMPAITKKLDKPNSYLTRIAVLYAVQNLISSPEMAGLGPDAIAVLTRCYHDPVSNVRYVAAKVSAQIASHLSAEERDNEIIRSLKELASDVDRDVSDMAAKALAQLTTQ